MNEIHKVIGVCPQHDILWDDLTVEGKNYRFWTYLLEHFLFHARLRGVSVSNEYEKVNQILEDTGLTDLRYSLSKNLSGGERRRLSIGIALVGDVAVV